MSEASSASGTSKTCRTQRVVGIVLMACGLLTIPVFFIGPGFRMGRVAAALTMAATQFSIGALIFSLGHYNRQIAELKAEIDRLRAGRDKAEEQA